MHVPRSLAAVALAVLLSTDVAAQAPLGEYSHSFIDSLGWLVYSLGDLDGDDRAELAVAYPSRHELRESWEYVEVYSPHGALVKRLAEWSPIWKTKGNTLWVADRCGEALVVLRRDELGFEVAVGAPGSGREPECGGAVVTWTGSTFEERRTAWSSTQPGAEFGAALAALPDFDADGRAELAVGAPGIAAVELYLTTNGARCGVITDSAPSTRFGAALAVVVRDPSDWSGAELAVGAPSSSLKGRERGAVHIHALSDGARTRSLEGDEDGEHFGARIIARDLERDGANELVVASLGGDGACASVSVVRTGDLTRRWRYGFQAGAREQGVVIDVCGDLNADGCDEVLVALSPSTFDVWPEVVVLSGVDGSLLHAIRSFHPVRGPNGREFLTEPIGFRLRSRLGVASAGDQDGDGLDDVWLAMRSTKADVEMDGFLSLLSGATLRSSTQSPPVVTRAASVSPHTVRTGDDRNVRLARADVPRIWTSFEPDNSDADGRAYDCGPSAYGRCVRTLGDLNGDGWDEVWTAGVYADFLTHSSFVVASDARATGESFDAYDFYDATRIHDVDADGIDDFALSVAEPTHQFCVTYGVVRLYSGATQRLLREIRGRGYPTTFGARMVRVGDVDGDGAAELAVATPSPEHWGRSDEEPGERTSSVSLLSLSPAASKNPFLLTLHGDATGADRFGRALAYGGDWDGDGVGDLAVGAPADSSRAALGGAVHIYSGATWERIASFASDVPRAGFGRELAWARDVDGDDRAELIASAPWSGADQRGCVLMLGSKRGEALWCTAGAREFDAFGASLVVGDLDGDGREELVVGAPGANREAFPHAASVSILDTTSGEVRATIEGELETPDAFKKGRLASRGDGAYVEDEPTLQRFGRSLAIARDLDGDNVADLVIGSPTYTGPQNAGMVYALSGAALMTDVARRAVAREGDPADFVQAPGAEIGALEKLWTQEAHHEDYQENSLSGCTESAFGRIVVWVGDRNSDGADDLVLGATLDFIDEQLVVASGRSGGALQAISDQLIHAVVRLGSSIDVAPSGFAVGSGEASGFFCNVYGRVRSFGGAARARELQAVREGFGNLFARSVADAGDLDGDGVPDFAIGFPQKEEGVRLVSGATRSTIDTLRLAVVNFGATLAAGRDFNRDGVGEIVVGAPGATGSGRAVVYSGNSRKPLASIEAPPDAGLFAQTLAVVDDCDGDGVAELVIGDPWSGPDSRGLVRLYSGRTVDVLRTWRGEHANASLGRSFCADHDLDGDGVRDFVMGAPGLGRTGPRGVVYVVSPTSGRVLLRIDGEPLNPEFRFLDDAQMRDPREFPRSHSFGWAVATGDFNGDGIADLAIGSPQAGTNNLVGIVYALSGVELRKHMAR